MVHVTWNGFVEFGSGGPIGRAEGRSVCREAGDRWTAHSDTGRIHKIHLNDNYIIQIF